MKLGLIMVLTPDLEEAERFYRDVIGLALVDKAASQLVFDLAGAAFMFFDAMKPPTNSGTPTAPRRSVSSKSRRSISPCNA